MSILGRVRWGERDGVAHEVEESFVMLDGRDEVVGLELQEKEGKEIC
jgi:hypothetical protein